MRHARLSLSRCSRQHAIAFVASTCLIIGGCVTHDVSVEALDASSLPMDMGRLDADEDSAQPLLDATPDATMPDAAPTPQELRVTLTPVEWGLFARDVDVTQVINETLVEGTPGTITLSPGVWDVEVCQQRQCFTFAADTLRGISGASGELLPVGEVGGGRARFFNAVDDQVELGWSSGRFTMRRTDQQLGTPRWSSPERQTLGVGRAFDEALARADSSTHTEVVLRLMQQLAALNAAPVRTSRGVLFVAPGEDGGVPPEIRGTLTNWERADGARTRKIGGALWGRYIELPEAPARHLYKTVYAPENQEATWFTDLANQHIEWDGFDPGGVGSFNSVFNERPGGSSGPGRMTLWWRVRSEVMQDERDVYVYLPPSYDEQATRRYPVLYVHDGNESIVRAQFHEVADAWFLTHDEDAAIVVFVGLPSQDERFASYTVGTADSRGELYAKFLAEELVPRVDERLRTRAERGARGLMGASLGGLISYWVGARYPETFEYVAGMSSSFFWEDELMIREISTRGCQDLWYYLDSGAPADNADVTRKMRDVLTQQGCRHEHREKEGGRHEWSFWKARFDHVLRTFALVHGEP